MAKERLTLPARRAGAAWHWRNDGSLWPRHHHDELELNIGLRGSITYLVEDRLVTVERDGLLALFPAQEHVVVDRSPGSEMWIAVWRPALMRRVLTGERAAWAAPLPVGDQVWRLEPRRARSLAGLCQAYASAIDDAAADACLEALLLSAWDAMRESRRGEAGTPVHPAVEAAVKRLRDDPALDGAALARGVGLSRERLSRLFRSQVGTPLSAYRAQLRLDRACDLIQAGRGNLLEAALASGFGSYAQFHRLVRARLGVSPRELAQDARHA